MTHQNPFIQDILEETNDPIVFLTRSLATLQKLPLNEAENDSWLVSVWNEAKDRNIDMTLVKSLK
ncbi:TPA: hypothetical protein HA278_06095 [Candidatus Woesearchaeota archaeon]|jgi:hypothetical protein|nr:hypothetical protein [Candidatus Woesearchaeota archaeon]|tara:strand:+ start:670 stop:864 length:195 start_codon:yes stop_codon:yes gene_type:complete